MHKRIMFRCMAHSDAIEQYISKKIEKLDKFFKRALLPISIYIVLDPHLQKHFYKVVCKINSGHYHKVIQNQGMDMYMMIDETIRKIIQDLSRKKEKHGPSMHLSYV